MGRKAYTRMLLVLKLLSRHHHHHRCHGWSNERIRILLKCQLIYVITTHLCQPTFLESRIRGTYYSFIRVFARRELLRDLYTPSVTADSLVPPKRITHIFFALYPDIFCLVNSKRPTAGKIRILNNTF